MHQRIDFYHDKARSPRLREGLDKDQAIVIAQEKAFTNMVDLFQFKQHLRDEMRPLVRSGVTVGVTANTFVPPADYRHLVNLEAVIDGVLVKDIRPMNYAESGPNEGNAFTEPAPDYPRWNESSTGILIECGAGVVSSVAIDYIRRPLTPYYSQQTIVAGPTVLSVGQTYFVQSGSVTHNTVTYSAGDDTRPGDTFVAANTALTGTGSVVKIQNCELGETCHEELCKIAAAIISGTVEDYSRFQVMAIQAKR